MKTKLLALVLLTGGSLFARSHWSVGFGVGFGAPVAYEPYGYYGHYASPVAYEPYHCARPAYVYSSSYWYPARYRYVVRTRYVRAYRPVSYYSARYCPTHYYRRAY